MEMNKRQLQKEETKKRIKEGAYFLYSEKGFSAPTAEIAKNLNISHGTVFSHFPTREDLICSLIEDFGSHTAAELNELIKDNKSMEHVLRSHIKSLKKHEKFYTRLISEIALLPPEIINTLISIQSTIAFHFNQASEIEIEKGKIKKIEPYLLFNNWIGFLHYYLQNSSMFNPTSSVLESHGEIIINTYLKLIKK